MNERLKQLMLAHGVHKNISQECQHRLEFVASLVAEECAQMCMSQADRKNIRRAFGLKVENDVKYSCPDLTNSVQSQYQREINIPKI